MWGVLGDLGNVASCFVQSPLNDRAENESADKSRREGLGAR